MCTAFLQRVEIGDLQGITSVVVLTEVAHRLMILEAINTFHLSSRTAIKTLKEHPSFVTQLTHYRVATEAIFACNVVVEPVASTHLHVAQRLSETYGLLTNDSLTAAVMQTLALTDVASNDGDLTAVSGLSIWQPQPTVLPS